MKPSILLSASVIVFVCDSLCRGATLSQTFEAGEDTTNWGSTWTNGTTEPTFLAPGLGGVSAGGGASVTQSFSRSFQNNTAGLTVTTDYAMSMYVQVGAFDNPASGLFEIVGGDYGSGNAGNLGIRTEQTSPGVYAYHWQARDNNNGWQDVGLTMILGTAYRVQIIVNPGSFTYSTIVESVDAAGNVQGTGQLGNLAFDQNVINNGQNDSLLFYIQASAGGTTVLVDNINIQSVPEPSAALLAALAGLTITTRRTRRSVLLF